MSLAHVQALSALREVARTATNPLPGTILSLASTVVDTIANAKSTTEDLRALSGRLVEVLGVLVPALSRGELVADPALGASIANLIRAIEQISRAIHKQLSRGKFHGILASSSSKIAVRQAQQDFELSLEVVNVALNFSNLRTGDVVKPLDLNVIKQQVRIAQEEQLNLIKEEVQKIDKKIKAPEHVLQMGSRVFHGRETEIDVAVSLLVRAEQANIALLGPGGIGKTSLALSVMHHPTVAARYEGRRYFIPCDAATSPEAVFEGFGTTLCISEERPLIPFKKLMEEIDRPLLISFDNFETPWEAAENRATLEKFLSELSSTPNVSLIITLRGAERPSGVEWSRPFLPPLQPLDLAAAARVFTAISDVPEDDPYMHNLILAVDMIPLAITLIATQAQYRSCENLLNMWNEQKTRMVTRGYDERLSSLDVSIKLSLESPRFTEEPAAMRLLQLLAILPEGGTDSLLSGMTDEGFPISRAAATLLRVSLAHRDAQGALKVLSPVREYIQTSIPISGEDLTTAFNYIKTLGQQYMTVRGKGEAARFIAQWAPQYGNIRSIIGQCFYRPQDIDPALSATVAAHLHHIFYGSVAQSQLDAMLMNAAQVSKEHGLRQHEAILRVLCDSADTDLDECLSTLREFNDSEGMMQCLERKGRDLYQRKPDEAIRIFDEAYQFDRRHISKPTLLIFYRSYAMYLSSRYQPAKALQVLREAIELAETEELTQFIPALHWTAARPHRLRGFYSKAREHVQVALDHVESPNQYMGVALLGVANLSSLQGRLDAADKAGTLSYQLFHHLDRVRDWGATVQKRLVAIYICQGRVPETLTLLEQYMYNTRDSALNPYEVSLLVKLAHDDLGQAGEVVRDVIQLCGRESRVHVFPLRFLIAEHRLRTGAYQGAMIGFIFLLANTCKSGFRLGISILLLRLGEVFRLGEQDVETARSCYQASLNLIRYIGVPRNEADTSFRLAASQALLGDTVSARSNAIRARDCFARVGYSLGVEHCGAFITSLDHRDHSVHHFALSSLPALTLLGYEDF